MQIKKGFQKFWHFLKEDSWQSWLVSLVLLIIFVKFIFFPTFSLITGSALPMVIVESCSMYHESSFEDWWAKNGPWYEVHNITKEQFEEFSLHNGLNKGDILLVLGRTKPQIGDIIIFEGGSKHPLIHRIISENPLGTKGDHNSDQLRKGNNIFNLDETDINSATVVGQAKFKIIPLIGWAKLIWFEPFRPKEERGFCR